MKVLLNQHYIDARCHLYPGKQYEVTETLGDFLVKNRMAVQIEEPKAEEPPHYGAQAEPESRQDENKYQSVRNRKGRRAS